MPAFLVALLHLFILDLHFPYIASDMYYYSSRLIDTYLHFKIEGIWSIQWWTPSFGAGTPAYPNPMHLQFSLTPYLLFVTDPWVSTLITYISFGLVGHILVYYYTKNHLGLGQLTSSITAVVFATNGYWLCHTMAGHLNYHSFPLIAIVPYILQSNWSVRKSSIIFAIVISYTIYSAGFSTIFLIYLSAFQLLFALPLVTKKNICYNKIFKIFVFSHLLILVICMSKIIAVMQHMELYPRLKSYSSWQPYFICFPLALITQLFSWKVLFPIELFLPVPADSILFWIIGSRYEFWENDVSLSPIVLFCFTLVFFIKKSSLLSFIKEKKNKSLLTGFILSLWITCEMSIGKGFTWTFIKHLPVIESTHVNVRYAGSLIPVMCILFAYCYNATGLHFRNIGKFKIFLFSLTLTLLSLYSYSMVSYKKLAFHEYDSEKDKILWDKIQNGETFTPIDKIIDIKRKDQVSHFFEFASSSSPHDPLYGYHSEYYQSKTEIGSVYGLSDSKYINFNDPRSFYSPKLLKLKVSQRLGVNGKIKNNQFLNRKQPKWTLPLIQQIANWTSFISILSIFIFFCFCIYKKINYKRT